MTYEILFSESALRQLRKLDGSVQARILDAIERVGDNPERHVTRLVDDPAYRLRVGDFRVLMDISNARLIILVIKVGHRKNIYG